MDNFDKINSLKNSKEKNKKLIDFYINVVKVNEWLISNSTNSIIVFKDRKEYKKFNKYHRLNGPAIDFDDIEKDKYYYRGVFYETKEEWEKISKKELRKIKLKKLNK